MTQIADAEKLGLTRLARSRSSSLVAIRISTRISRHKLSSIINSVEQQNFSWLQNQLQNFPNPLIWSRWYCDHIIQIGNRSGWNSICLPASSDKISSSSKRHVLVYVECNIVPTGGDQEPPMSEPKARIAMEPIKNGRKGLGQYIQDHV